MVLYIFGFFEKTLPMQKNKYVTRKTAVVLSLLFSALFFSCNEDDCYEPSKEIIFEFVNSNNENLIENGSINPSNIAINKIVNANYHVGINGNKVVNNRVVLHPAISRYDGTQEFMFITNLKLFNFHIASSKVANCNAYTINDITFDSVNSTKYEEYYKITL